MHVRRLAVLGLALLVLASSINSLPPRVWGTSDWLVGWDYRKSHVIAQAAGAGTNYQIAVNVSKPDGTDGTLAWDFMTVGLVYCNNSCNDDFSDIRFAADDGTTLLEYWVEDYSSGVWALFWVKIAGDLSAGDVTIYVYYGHADATSESSIEATMIFGDDFLEDANVDWADRWQSNDQTLFSVSGGELVAAASNPATTTKNICTQAKYSVSRAVAVRYRGTITGQSYFNLEAVAKTYTGKDEICIGQKDVKVFERINSQVREYSENVSVNSFRSYFLDVGSGNLTEFCYRVSNGGLVGNNSQGQPGSGHDTYVQLMAWVPGATSYFRYVYVRKYVAPEPAHGAWGSQQHVDYTPPTWSNCSSNETKAGVVCLFSVDIADEIGLDGWVYGTNNTGDWVNETWVNLDAHPLTESLQVTKILNNTVDVRVEWTFWFNDTSDNWNSTASDSQKYLQTIGHAPFYYSVSQNTTRSGAGCRIQAYFNGSVDLSGFISGTNNTGSWVNETWTGLSGLSSWVTYDFIVNDTFGVRVEWCFWVNNTLIPGAWNDTGVQFFISTGLNLTIYLGTGGQLAVNSTIISNATAYNVIWNSNFTLQGYANGGYIFQNFSWTAADTLLNPYTLMLTDDWVLWAYFTLPTGGMSAQQQLAAGVAAVFILIPTAIMIFLVIGGRRKR